jgi:hypothetical protein
MHFEINLVVQQGLAAPVLCRRLTIALLDVVTILYTSQVEDSPLHPLS